MRSLTDLYPHQKRAIEFLRTHDNVALFCDMGLGKSVIALTAFAEMLDAFDARHALIVAPLRVARKVFVDELAAWSHLRGLTTSRILGTAKQRLEAMRTGADIHLINVENVAWLESQFIQGKKQIKVWPWDIVILDESQMFRSQSSKRFKALRRLRRLFPRLIELTGTPAPNGIGGLWSQIYLLDKGQRLGATESAFHERWFTEIKGDGYSNWILKPGADTEIQRVIGDIVLSLRSEDYFTLPPVRWNPVRVALSAAGYATYRKFERTYISEFNGKTVTAQSAGVLGNKLAQLANGSIYYAKDQFEIFHNEKLDALEELLEGISGQALIGYAFRSDASRISGVLEKFCKENGKSWAFAESDDDLNRFSRGEIDYMLIHPASAGHGLNDLYKAGCCNIVWFGLPGVNLEWFQQLNARLTGGLRMLERGVTIHLILADQTRDDDMWPMLTAKDATQDKLTKALRAKDA